MSDLVRLVGIPYSGRGMFGRRCLAFDSLYTLLSAIRMDPTLSCDGWLSDSLGKGMVYYNPSIPPPVGPVFPKDSAASDEDD